MPLTYGTASEFIGSTSATLERSVRITSIFFQDLYNQLRVMAREARRAMMDVLG